MRVEEIEWGVGRGDSVGSGERYEGRGDRVGSGER